MSEIDIFRDSIQIEKAPDGTYVIVTVQSLNEDRNSLQRISCDRGLPLGGYAYNTVNDCYLFTCYDYRTLGYVPASFEIKISGAASWSVPIPMPEELIVEYLDEGQRETLRSFKSNYFGDEYKFSYLQLIASDVGVY